MIMMSVICRLMYASYDRWPIVVHISAQKGLIMIKHPVTKNSAKEEPQNCIAKTIPKKIIFHTFKYIFFIILCLSFIRIFVVIVLF